MLYPKLCFQVFPQSTLLIDLGEVDYLDFKILKYSSRPNPCECPPNGWKAEINR